MYYSVTFTNSNGVSKNTWTDWNLIPSSPPQFEPPEPYTNYVDIPGRTEGPIDLSEVLTNQVSYSNSEGEWSFVSANYTENRTTKYAELKSFLHGKRMKIITEEDPTHYRLGRIFVSGIPQTGKGPNVYSFKYIIEPLRYNVSNDEPDGI